MRLFAIVLLLSAVASAQQVNFVSCPMVRDTKTSPCFLAEYNGETYFLGTAPDAIPDFHAPQLKHQVLVEGRAVPGPKVCGGIPLQPVVLSVMREVNLACNILLPPEPGIDAPTPPHFAKPAEPSTGPREFTLAYSFNDDDLAPAVNAIAMDAAAYATRIHASAVRIDGYRSATDLSNGTRLVEKEALAETRAQNIATLLRGLNVANVKVEWKKELDTEGPTGRRVVVSVTP